LLSLPVRLHGIPLGRPVDLILEPDAMRLLGLEVRCGDDEHRFLPFAAARIGEGEIAIASPLLLLDELPFYRAQGRSLQSLRGARVKARGAEAVILKDVLVGDEGRIERLLVVGAAGEHEVPVDEGVRLEEPRAPAA
jgi:hypothetical protein